MSGKDIAIALWVVFLWSTNLIVQKIAASEISIFLLSFLRVVLVFPLLLFYSKPPKSLWKYFLCGFFLLALYLILFGFGLKSTIGAGLSAFFLQTQVLFVILCCFLFLGEKPTGFQITGLFVSSIGVYLLQITSSPSEVPFTGVIFLLMSCVSFGVGIALSKKYKIGENMADITWLSMAASIPLFFSCLLFEGPVHSLEIIVNISSTAIFCILFATVLSTIWATYLWLNLLQRIPASFATPFMLLLPIFSNIISNLVLDENLSLFQIFAGFIIILGVIIAQGMHQRLSFLRFWVKNRIAS